MKEKHKGGVKEDSKGVKINLGSEDKEETSNVRKQFANEFTRKVIEETKKKLKATKETDKTTRDVVFNIGFNLGFTSGANAGASIPLVFEGIPLQGDIGLSAETSRALSAGGQMRMTKEESFEKTREKVLNNLDKYEKFIENKVEESTSDLVQNITKKGLEVSGSNKTQEDQGESNDEYSEKTSTRSYTINTSVANEPTLKIQKR